MTVSDFKNLRQTRQSLNLGRIRGFAQIGMVEYWNIGKMGLGIRQDCLIGNIRLDLKVKTDKILQKPQFHRSTIPLFQN